MSQTAGTLRRAIALSLIPALMVVLGAVGVVSIDQGRIGAGTVTAMADQAQRLGSASLGVEAARRLAAAGQTDPARKALDGAIAAIRTAAREENAGKRRTRITDLLPIADTLRAGLADAGQRDAAGATLSRELAALDHLAGQDLLEAEAEVPPQILQTEWLYGVLVLILAAAATFTAFLAGRPSKP